MTDSQQVHDQIFARLRSETVLDLTTLPTQIERADLQSRVQKIIDTDFSNIDSKIKKRILAEFFSAGPIEALIEDPEITEIMLNGPNVIWFEKYGKIQAHEDTFYSPVSFQNFLHRLSADARIQANLDHPYVDGYWRQYRVHLIIPPLAQNGAHLSLRRHPKNPWTLSGFEEVGWASADALKLLKNMIKNRTSFLIVGATGTGKTSVLNACLQEIEPNERTVIIEDTNELQLPNSLSAKLLTRIDPLGVLQNVNQEELLRQALRMRPDRIIMGEVRGAEAKDLLMAFSTGHTGGIGTLHADNARQSLFRLEMLIQMGAPQWSLRAIRHLIYFGLQAIVSVRRIDGKRQLDSIHKIVSLEDTGFCLERIF
jgi:pilus assembly protein CpaF